MPVLSKFAGVTSIYMCFLKLQFFSRPLCLTTGLDDQTCGLCAHGKIAPLQGRWPCPLKLKIPGLIYTIILFKINKAVLSNRCLLYIRKTTHYGICGGLICLIETAVEQEVLLCLSVTVFNHLSSFVIFFLL